MDEAAHPKEQELRELMISGLDGDEAAHRALLERLSAHLRGYFKHRFARIGHGPTEAEDLVQEALIAIHTRRHTYDRSQPFTPWAYAIARYKFLDYLRRTKASFRDISIEDASEFIANDDTGSIDSDLDLERLMAGLSSKTRHAIQCVKLEGLSVREAAEKCGMSESAIKVSVHRGLRALAALMSREKRI
jgi:RNA polymerase sigma-70 factor (ECF subfamily)